MLYKKSIESLQNTLNHFSLITGPAAINPTNTIYVSSFVKRISTVEFLEQV